MMSFNSKDLMIDVLPAGKPFAAAQPGFALCAQITAGGDDGDDLDCGQATADEPETATRTEAALALLRHQLRQALAPEARP
jgi:hypothetical protein